MELMTMETLFNKVGLDYKSMEKNTFYDVSDKNVKIKCFSHKDNKVEMKKVLSVVRKDDAFVYQIVSKSGDILLECSGNHRIWDEDKHEYIHVQELQSGVALNSTGDKIEFFVRKTEELSPIVDLEVEDNSNYFTNGILSHNTTAGGNALKFYASIRLKFSKIGTIETGSGDNKEKTSVRTRVEAVKNKTAAPFKKAEFIISFGKGIDNEAAYFDAIIERGLVQVKGAGWYSIDGKNVAQGTTKLKAYFEENPEIYERLKSAVMNNTSAVPAKEEPVEANNMTDDEIAESVEEEVGEFPAKG